MKKYITIIFLFASVAGFSQTKKDSVPPVPAQPTFSMTMSYEKWQALFFRLRQNGKMTGNEIEDMIDDLLAHLQPVPKIEPPKKK